MHYRTLGRTGAQVSEIGFGGAGAGLRNYIGKWDPTQEEQIQLVEQAIRRAVELGINYFDTAPLYGSEVMFGKALKPFRDSVFIATKVREKNAADTRESIEDSLTRLETDRIDLIQYHGGWYSEEEMHNILKPDGVLAGMQAACQEGLVRYIGFTSEGTNGAVSRLIDTQAFDVMQIQYNLMFQHPYDPDKHAGVMVEAEAQKMGIALMRPFPGGVFPRWLKLVYPDIESHIDMDKLMAGLLTLVLSNPMTDVAIIGMRLPELVEKNCAISDDLDARFDLDPLYDRFLRKRPGSDEET
ncbi:MAG: aldo/keto reductase, partial [Anaerolineales bacterium]